MKIVTGSYVLKFVGGDGQVRKCAYCQKDQRFGVLCVYPNCSCDQKDSTNYVCRKCVNAQCIRVEKEWKRITKNARVRPL